MVSLTSSYSMYHISDNDNSQYHLLNTGDVDRDEWRDTVSFYLELKEEEVEMSKEKDNQVEFMKRLREKKLAALGKGGGGPSVAAVEEGIQKVEKKEVDSARREAEIIED
jgi:hypothetical protein